MSADTLLSRLEKVRKTGNLKWMARCPAHADKTPSLSITEFDDSRIRFKCFGGCESRSVLQAVGLNWKDVFPKSLNQSIANRQRKPPLINSRDALNLIYESVLTICVIAADMTKNRTISAQDFESLSNCCARISRCMDEVQRG